MLAELVARRLIAVGKLHSRLGTMHGFSTIVTFTHIQWERRSRINGVCTTCMAMLGSGAWIGTVNIRQGQLQILCV